MEYYRDLNRDDFPSDETFEEERIKRGLACGFTLHQIALHQLIELGLALGLTQEEIVARVGNDSGYVFS